RVGDLMKIYENRWKYLFFTLMNTIIFLSGNVLNKKLNGYKVYPSDISFSLVFGVLYGLILAHLIISFFDQQKETEELDFEVQASLHQLEAFNEELLAQNDELESFAHIISNKEKELREIINLSPIHIYLKDLEGKYLLCNKAHAEFIGEPIQGIEGKSQGEFSVFEKGKIDDYQLVDEKIISGNETNEYIEKINNGEIDQYFKINKIPVELTHHSKEILVVAQEITDLVNMQNEIDLKNKKLLEDNEELIRLNNETNRLANDFEKIIRLITGVIDDVSDEEYLKNIFALTLNLMSRSKKGIIYLFDQGIFKLVQAEGVHKSVADAYLKSYAPDLSVGKNEVRYIENKGSEAFNKFLCIGFYYGEKQIGGMSLESTLESKIFTEEDIRLFKSIGILVNNYYMNRKILEVQQTIQNSIIISLVKMLELFDEYTKGHSESVADLSMKLASEMGVKDTSAAYWAGMVHDIGKILVDRKILNKKGGLTFEEYENIKMHPYWGYQVLNRSEELKDIAKYVLYHHERYDGMGYPEGLVGEEIPLISQIITVVDSFHTMRSRRAYKEPMTIKETIHELKDQKGRQFSPMVVDVFINKILVQEEILEINEIQ
ncbi:MAG TPA: HD-GYP domain-containing protein, partial [Clostridia bacterium]|nr:HD-GYP domain-containing protein [Clostridia bacterium]